MTMANATIVSTRATNQKTDDIRDLGLRGSQKITLQSTQRDQDRNDGFSYRVS